MASPVLEREPGIWQLWLLVLVAAALYLLLHPYDGIIHDSRLYVLQALGHLRPDLYGNDVFLKFGSQDNYTLFTPLFAPLVESLGAEAAASLVTFLSAMALIASVWTLGRTLDGPVLAWIGAGLLITVSGYYGSGTTFAVLENFATPRMPAEALALSGIAASMAHRRWLAVVLLLAALVIHPIMTFPVIVLLLMLDWGLDHRQWIVRGILMAALLAALACLGWLPVARWQFDAEWWSLLENTTNLRPELWTSHDWGRVSTVMATLAIAGIRMVGPAQRLGLAMLVTTVLMLLLAWIGGDILHVVIIVQGQAWRVLWLATTVALVLLPSLAVQCWRNPPLSKAAILLLSGAWLMGRTDLAAILAILALLPATISARSPLQRHGRIAAMAAGILLTVTILALQFVAWSSSAVEDAREAGNLLELIRSVCSDISIPTLVLVATGLVASRIRSDRVTGFLAASLTLSVVILGALTYGTWTRARYPEAAREEFAAWRELIPVGTDVLWATRLMEGSDPATVWLLLERPSFYSSTQANSGLFSRAAAMELHRRGKSIPPALPTELPFNLTIGGKEGLPPSCSQVPATYIVTDVPIRDARVIEAPTSAGEPFSALRLQICDHGAPGMHRLTLAL
jgi:hypothetical protein